MSSDKRRMRNLVLDRKLQFRYFCLFLVFAVGVSIVLGSLLYQQERANSVAIRQALHDSPFVDFSNLEENVKTELDRDDSSLFWQMALVGLGLFVSLSLFALLVTHRIAGPLHKVGQVFDRMADDDFSPMVGLRRGDLISRFYLRLRAAHETIRRKRKNSAESVLQLVDVAEKTGELEPELQETLALLRKHYESQRETLL